MNTYITAQTHCPVIIVTDCSHRLAPTMWCCRQVTDDGLTEFSQLQKLQVLVMNNLGQGVSGLFLGRLQGKCCPMILVLHLPSLLFPPQRLTCLLGPSSTVSITICSPSRLHMAGQATSMHLMSQACCTVMPTAAQNGCCLALCSFLPPSQSKRATSCLLMQQPILRCMSAVIMPINPSQRVPLKQSTNLDLCCNLCLAKHPCTHIHCDASVLWYHTPGMLHHSWHGGQDLLKVGTSRYHRLPTSASLSVILQG